MRSTSTDGASACFSEAPATRSSANEFIQTDRNGLPQVHRDVFVPASGIRISQWQWLRSFRGKSVLLRAKQEGDATGLHSLPNQPCAILQPPQWMLQFPMTHGGCSDHQRTIGDGFGHALVFLRLLAAMQPRRPLISPCETPLRRDSPLRGGETPKLLMARAAAPILRGLRASTSTTRRLSDFRKRARMVILKQGQRGMAAIESSSS